MAGPTEVKIHKKGEGYYRSFSVLPENKFQKCRAAFAMLRTAIFANLTTAMFAKIITALFTKFITTIFTNFNTAKFTKLITV